MHSANAATTIDGDGQERYFSALFATVRLAEAGHFLHHERPHEVNRAIVERFLAH